MRFFSSALKIFGFIVLILGFLFVNARVHDFRDRLPPEQLRAEALMIDPTLLKIISGEFKGLLADYLNLKAAIFKGGAQQTTTEDWEAMAILFKQSIQLDPYFFHTAYYTQGMMAWRDGMHEKAIEILKINSDARTWDWEPRFYLGFDYFYYLNDIEKGAHYLIEASKLPNAQPITATLAARLVQRSGRTLTAIAFLKTMLERSKDEYTKYFLTKRLILLLGLHQLEKAHDVYVEHFGTPPKTIEELFAKGFVTQFPEDVDQKAYGYDPQSGHITLR